MNDGFAGRVWAPAADEQSHRYFPNPAQRHREKAATRRTGWGGFWSLVSCLLKRTRPFPSLKSPEHLRSPPPYLYVSVPVLAVVVASGAEGDADDVDLF